MLCAYEGHTVGTVWLKRKYTENRRKQLYNTNCSLKALIMILIFKKS